MKKLKTVTDQIGNKVTFTFPPQRIVSLVPSQSELLYDLGLDEQVVGITKFCELPVSWFKSKTKIGGTKKIHLEIVDSLHPDLIIGNKEENDKANVENLWKKYPVWMSDIFNLHDALAMISSVGEITNTKESSNIIVSQITSAFDQIRKYNGSVLYLIWKKPWMGVGTQTFINDMLERIGLVNVLRDRTRYPELSSEQIHDLKPDYIFLSTEPYPFQEKHLEELKDIAPYSQLKLVDGQFFSWYGSRLIKAPEYFRSLDL